MAPHVLDAFQSLALLEQTGRIFQPGKYHLQARLLVGGFTDSKDKNPAHCHAQTSGVVHAASIQWIYLT